jgi:geranylgeranyl diphosphate synthase type II
MGISTSRTPTTDAGAFLADAAARIGRALACWKVPIREAHPGPVGDAIVYALEGQGKRLRPALTLAVHRATGAPGDAAMLAAAVEVVHTYSLVHDDLPCMDDDDLRRGRPTVHRVFGVPVATEAGWRMVPLAAEMVTRGAAELGLSAGAAADAARTLFVAAGVSGMIGGQVLDLEAERHALDLDALKRLHRAKTGALLAASAEIGAIAAGLGGARRDAVRGFGQEVGLAFQIVDDVLDAVESSDQLGKTAGKDARQGKATYPALLGVAGARAEARACLARGMDRLKAAEIDSDLLMNLARFVVDRRS